MTLGLDLPWPAGLPGAVRDDWASLVPKLLVLADRMIRRRGAFLPYGMSLGLDGETTDLGSIGDNGEAMLELMRGFCRARRAELAAAAFAYGVEVRGHTSRRDAIAVSLEHRAASQPLTI